MDTRLLLAYFSEWLGVAAVAWLLSLAPRLRHQPIGFRYARRDGLTALGVYASILAFSFLFGTGGLANTLAGWFKVPTLAEPLIRPLLLAVICVVPFILACIIREQPPKSMGWNAKQLRFGLQVGLAMALLTIFLRNRVMDVISGISSDEGLYLLIALGIALAEETIFRGYIQTRLEWWLGPNYGLVATALMYAAWRFPAALIQGLSFPMLMLNLGIALMQGLVAGWLMRKTGHVAAPAIYRAISMWMNVFM